MDLKHISLLILFICMIPGKATAQWSFSITCQSHQETVYTSIFSGEKIVETTPGGVYSYNFATQAECETARIDYYGRTPAGLCTVTAACINTGGMTGDSAEGSRIGSQFFGTISTNPANEIRDWAEDSKELMDRLIQGKQPAGMILRTGDDPYDNLIAMDLKRPKEMLPNSSEWSFNYEFLDKLTSENVPDPEPWTIKPHFERTGGYYYASCEEPDSEPWDERLELQVNLWRENGANSLLTIGGDVLVKFAKVSVSARSAAGGAWMNVLDKVEKIAAFKQFENNLINKGLQAIKESARTMDARYVNEYQEHAGRATQDYAYKTLGNVTAGAAESAANGWFSWNKTKTQTQW